MNRVDSEVGRLRTVLLHRPGAELTRITPRNTGELLFDGVPWAERAQLEHDVFAATLTDRGVEVLLLGELLTETLRDEAARTAGIAAAVDARRLGPVVHPRLLVLGGRPRGHHLAGHARAASGDLGDRPGVRASPAVTPAPTAPTGTPPHPWRAGTCSCWTPGCWPWERTTAAGAEAFARSAFADGLAHTVLAVPIAQARASMHLDTVCTMVDRDAVVMYPAVQDLVRVHHPVRG